MYPVLPDPNDGNVKLGAPDALTMVYIDRTLNLGTAAKITPSGSQVDVTSVTGVNIGDLIILEQRAWQRHWHGDECARRQQLSFVCQL